MPCIVSGVVDAGEVRETRRVKDNEPIQEHRERRPPIRYGLDPDTGYG